MAIEKILCRKKSDWPTPKYSVPRRWCENHFSLLFIKRIVSHTHLHTYTLLHWSVLWTVGAYGACPNTLSKYITLQFINVWIVIKPNPTYIRIRGARQTFIFYSVAVDCSYILTDIYIYIVILRLCKGLMNLINDLQLPGRTLKHCHFYMIQGHDRRPLMNVTYITFLLRCILQVARMVA